ncbi:glycoside hydrolase family 6 protein [Luedemannella helvata]|uniref:glycoside hydrolase family 6 protein n=1 Tax=Luedemannella helvata TaxID=349315 RepID=UPI0031D58397
MSRVISPKPARTVAVISVVLIGLLSGCGDEPPAQPEVWDTGLNGPAGTRGPGGTEPIAGRQLYVNPESSAAKQIAAWRAEGRTADAEAIAEIADRPTAVWLTADAGAVEAQVDRVVGAAQAADRLPVLVTYNIPHRDCGGYSSGGAASPEAYREWMAAIARGIGGRPVVVILEPDAIPHVLDGCLTERINERFALLTEAIATLKATGRARVYLDAGNPNWVDDVPKLARALRHGGVEAADGFSLNVSNFIDLDKNLDYGARVSDELGGAHFVIDTSRNGNGALPAGGQTDGGPNWCNPPGRALGHPPTTEPDVDRVDAYLWVKFPGESDGACRPGEPRAGQWWPDYALGLVASTK